MQTRNPLEPSKIDQHQQQVKKMNPNELLDAARTNASLTDADLARRLGIGRATVANWRTIRQPIPDSHVITLAKLAALDPAQILVEIHAERAPGEVGKVWKEIARRAALSVMIAAAISISSGLCKEAKASSVYYVKRMLRRLARLAPSIRPA
jgi:DNA-binding transcriptional regulator YiaG